MKKTTKCFECDGSGWDKETLSYCCGVFMPDYPDNGFCPKCNEHTEPNQCEKCAGTGELDLSEHPHDLIEKGRKYDELKASHERLKKACLLIKEFDNVDVYSEEWETLADKHMKLNDEALKQAK